MLPSSLSVFSLFPQAYHGGLFRASCPWVAFNAGKLVGQGKPLQYFVPSVKRWLLTSMPSFWQLCCCYRYFSQAYGPSLQHIRHSANDGGPKEARLRCLQRLPTIFTNSKGLHSHPLVDKAHLRHPSPLVVSLGRFLCPLHLLRHDYSHNGKSL